MRGSSMLSDAGLQDLAGAAPGLEVGGRRPGARAVPRLERRRARGPAAAMRAYLC
jgi:hypothetical protein